jgi:DNA (cytosine-5)-methyltransferase 1
VSTFDGKPWRGVVDLVAGGFPCQDISAAGKGSGIIEGERSGLWREFARIIREVEPRYVFVENVSALIVRGLDVVLGDLAALGFDAEWGVFRASDVGAPHRRERVFILADREGRGQRVVGDKVVPRRRGHADRCDEGVGPYRSERWIPCPCCDEYWCALHEQHAFECPCPPLENAELDGLERGEREVVAGARGRGQYAEARGSGDGVGDSARGYAQDAPIAVRRLRPGQVERRGGRRDLGSHEWPPGPEDGPGWQAFLERHPETQPAVRGSPHGMAHRTQRLRLLGNGVVPQCAALAWEVLMQRMTGEAKGER